MKLFGILGSVFILLIAAVGVFAFLIDQENPELALDSLDDIQFDLRNEEPPTATITQPEQSEYLLQPDVEHNPPTTARENGPISTPQTNSAQPELEIQNETPFEYEGRLKLIADGKLFGEEQFRLTRAESGAFRLVSTGYFQFKVVLVNTKFQFQQAIAWQNGLYPDRLAFKINGPLGVGSREFDIEFSPEEPYRTASIRSGNQEKDVRLPSGDLAVQGTFSSFAMLPYILGDRGEAEVHFIVANSFGPTDSAGASSNELMLVRVGTKSVSDGRTSLTVAEYDLLDANQNPHASSGSLRILFADGELIGIYALSEDERAESFQVYRADIFPDGFEIERYN